MSEIYRLLEIVDRLRSDGGCPWDRVQTHESLKPHCIEEAAEVVCGINVLRDTGNSDSLKEELGDLLFQVVLHSRIAKEEGLFDFEDVCKSLSDKMIRRHPNVFGEMTVDENGNTLKDWSDIKAYEKKGREWMEQGIFDAFDESIDLVEKARKRKEEKLINKD